MIITCDFETYYDKEYSLARKDTTTESYIRNPRFEVIGVSVKTDDDPAVWITGSHTDISRELKKFPFETCAFVAHNTLFDGTILKWIFDIEPKFYIDTLSMARAIHGVDSKASLAELVSRYGLGRKGDEVVGAIGKHRSDFSPVELEAYGRYCCNDTELTYKLFNSMAESFPEPEYDLIDLTLRMFISPALKLDIKLLQDRLEDIGKEKEIVLERLQKILGCTNSDQVSDKLASNPQFAEILKLFGARVPTKLNSKGKTVPALAKKDEGFIALQDHEDPLIRQLVAARLGVKSTIEESRICRFIDIAGRNESSLPIPLKYYGAHTGRWSGMDAINLQNIPTRDKAKRTLKESIVAPESYCIINADSSQIEARILAWLSDQQDLISAFRERRDVYSEFASKVFRRPVERGDVLERFVGKTCILGLGYGTGAEKLRHTLATSPPCAEFTREECQGFVDIYRTDNYKIKELWYEADRLLRSLMSWPSDVLAIDFGQKGVVHADSSGIKLPNQLYIRYNNLHISEGRITHDSRKGPRSIWGGAVVENVVQGLARIVVGTQMVEISRRIPVALTVHDSIVCVVPKIELDSAREFIEATMSVSPVWAPDLPLACEIKTGTSYGQC